MWTFNEEIKRKNNQTVGLQEETPSELLSGLYNKIMVFDVYDAYYRLVQARFKTIKHCDCTEVHTI